MATVPATLDDLSTPCLVVDLDVVKANCARMRQRWQDLGIKLRPHVKTHKTLEAGRLQTDGTMRGIVVSTVKEAEFFADGGFDDIAYARIVTEDKIPRLRALAQRLEKFIVLVDCPEHRDILEAAPVADDKKWFVMLKVDFGYKRTGIDWENATIPNLARSIEDPKHMTFEGIYTHEGHAYAAQGEEVKDVADEVARKLLRVAELREKEGTPCQIVSVGSTPSCSLPGQLFNKITETHPGTYVFYDAQHMQIGACKCEDIALRVATRVMAQYPERNEVVVDCGFTALSHDGKGELPNNTWCLVEGHPTITFARMSQEFGVLASSDGRPLNFDRLSVGTLLLLIPFHACATAAMHPVYYVHSKRKLVETWTPCRGW